MVVRSEGDGIRVMARFLVSQRAQEKVQVVSPGPAVIALQCRETGT